MGSIIHPGAAVTLADGPPDVVALTVQANSGTVNVDAVVRLLEVY